MDHPSFANALIGRYLENLGYSVAILAQPNYGDRRAYQALGRPRLAFLVSGGHMDSMVNLYSANRVRRQYDMSYTGGEVLRPRRAVTVLSLIHSSAASSCTQSSPWNAENSTLWT